jgi:D-alanyl-D-alanine carboxypeptidase
MSRLGIVSLFALVLALCGAIPAAAAPPERADAALENALDAVVGAPGGPPGVISVVRRGRDTQVHRSGVGNIRRGRAWRASDHMRLASVTKAYSGAVALSLVQRDRMELDDTIGELLPNLPAAWSAVTLSQLLQHRSGLPNYTRNRAFLEDFAANTRRSFTPLELIDYVDDETLAFPPGSAYAYSNTDNIVVALMTEAATRRSYGALLRTRVFRPLGLTETSMPRDWRIPRPFAHGYDIDPPARPQDISEAISVSGVWASGGMVSTPMELLEFMQAYVRGDLFGRSLRRAQRRVVTGSSEPPGPGVNAAGLGLFRYRTSCGTVYGHTGNFPGYTQFAAASPNGRRVATVSANTQLDVATGSRRAFRLLRRAFDRAACAALAR